MTNGSLIRLQSAAGPDARVGERSGAISKVFELADARGVLSDPELAMLRMKCYLSVSCGIEA
jgi:hypothetical protein